MIENVIVRNVVYKRILNSVKKIHSRDMISYIFLALLSLMICIVFTTSPYSKVMPWTDSDVFIEIGILLKKGYVLYRTVFDHKGPLLFFIQYVGLMISNGNNGIWIIEVISLWLTLIFFYKTIRIWNSPIVSIITILISSDYLSKYLAYGNYTEEYALPLVAISMFLFSKYFENKKYELSRNSTIILGIMFGMAIMLRPNTAALWPVFCLIILINTIILKKYKLLIQYIIYFLIGSVISLAPMFIYMIIHNAWSDFIFSYLTFNFSYANDVGMYKRLQAMIYFIKNYTAYISLLGFLLIMCYKEKLTEERKLYFFTALFFQLIALLCTIMSGELYDHYGLQLIPTYVIPVSFCVDKVVHFFLSIKKYAIYPICIISVFTICLVIISNDKQGLLLDIKGKTSILLYEGDDQINETKPIINYIKEKTNENDKIIVYGNSCKIYTASNRKPASKYLYQQLIRKNMPIAKEFITDIQKTMPKIIILSKNYLKDQSGDYPYATKEINKIIEGDYEKDMETANMIIYIRK